MICYVDLRSSLAERLVAACAAPEDCAAAPRHRLPRRQRQSVTVRALARAMLCRDSGIPPAAWRFEKGLHGAPIAASAGSIERALSFAHSAEMAGCAIARQGPIGFDIERIRADRPVEALARSAFGPAEIGEVEANGAAAFYKIWVLREAMAKATGQGFALLVNQRDLVLPELDGAAGRLRLGPSTWRAGSWTIDDAYAIGFVQMEAVKESGALPVPRPFRSADLEIRL
jgi:4'-phosphopantetheinyl transferase